MTQSTFTEDELRYAVVGLGSIGRRHLANLRALRPAARIAACSLSGQTREIPAGVKSLQSLQGLVEFAPSAAILAGPASTRAFVGTELAKAGIHLFLEKPLATCASDAELLTSTFKSESTIATVGYNLRIMPGLRSVRDAIEKKKIGTVISVRSAVGQYLPDWRPTQDYRSSVSAKSKLGGGALLELSHELDYLLWMFGVPDTVFAQGGKFSALEIDVEDVVELTLGYLKKNLIVAVHLDLLDRCGFRELRIIADEGTLVWNGLNDRVEMYRATDKHWTMEPSPYIADKNIYYQRELEEFLTCVECGTTPSYALDDAVSVLKVIDCAKLSMLSGKIVPIQGLGLPL